MKNGKYEEADVYLRPLTINDAEISWKWRNDSRVWARTVSKPPHNVTLDMERAWASKVLGESTSLRFAICLKEDDRYVGNVYLTDIDWEQKIGSQGTFIGDVSVWGKGVGTCARLAMHRIVAEEYGIRCVRSKIRLGNVASLKSAEKSGFRMLSHDAEFAYMEKYLDGRKIAANS